MPEIKDITILTKTGSRHLMRNVPVCHGVMGLNAKQKSFIARIEAKEGIQGFLMNYGD